MRDMKTPIATLLASVALLGAAGIALFRPAESAQATPVPVGEPESYRGAEDLPGAPSQLGPGALAGPEQLPPNHPPISGGSSPHGGGAAPSAPDELAAIAWTVPKGWHTASNPNAMRIATYRPAENCELSVVRAGGTTDANIQRWIGQFDEPAHSQRTRKLVQGLRVEVVDIGGTYAGGGMMPGSPAEPHAGWKLLGAVVETPGSHYFFKLVGPSAEVTAAHASFDALIASVRPLQGAAPEGP